VALSGSLTLGGEDDPFSLFAKHDSSKRCEEFAARSAMNQKTLTYWLGRPVPLPLLWLFIGHLMAMSPDILFTFRLIAHRPWMDIFL